MKKAKSDEDMDSDIMDDLIDAMSGRDADSLYPPESGNKEGTVIEIHIKPGQPPVAEKESEDEESREEGMLPKPNELDAMMKRGMTKK